MVVLLRRTSPHVYMKHVLFHQPIAYDQNGNETRIGGIQSTDSLVVRRSCEIPTPSAFQPTRARKQRSCHGWTHIFVLFMSLEMPSCIMQALFYKVALLLPAAGVTESKRGGGGAATSLSDQWNWKQLESDAIALQFKGKKKILESRNHWIFLVNHKTYGHHFKGFF